MKHYTTIALITLVLGFVTLTIFQAASAERMKVTEGWKPPEIPQCDKPVWERIVDGC